MGAIGDAVGGIAGAIPAMATEAGKSVVSAFGDCNLNIGKKLFAALVCDTFTEPFTMLVPDLPLSATPSEPRGVKTLL
jgi:hypothetical protein